MQYKKAINDYETKKNKTNEPSLSETIRRTLVLPDFCSLPKIEYDEPAVKNNFDEAYWRDLLSEVSGLYNRYEGLQDISASIMSNYSNIYTINTEGSEMRHANSDITLNVRIVAEGKNKTFFSENLLFSGFSTKDFPSKQEVIAQTKEAADLVLAVSKAELLDKEYFGPALIDGPMLINFQMLGSLSAVRTPVMGGVAALGGNDNVGIRLFSPNISIKATPTLKEFNGQKLLGSYFMDADGVKPEEEFILVEKGIQKKFLGDRIPTLGTTEPTGNNLHINNIQNIGTQVAPGVLQVVGSETESAEVLRRRLIDLAKENGEKYAFVVRQLKNGTTSWFYRVDTGSGEETLVGGCRVNLNGNKPLRRIVGVSDHPRLFNLKYYGINNSIISPDHFLLEEISIVKM